MAPLREAFRRPPLLSIVVVVYRMPEQADRTLHTLSTAYQLGVSELDYEVIVVENASDMPLGESAARRHGSNFRYLYREEPAPTPVHALNEGGRLARAPIIGLMIDGARLLTPGIVQNVLRAGRITSVPVVSVPGYHLGHEIQQEAVDSGYGTEAEAELLRSIDWPSSGYRLFEIACFSGSCAGGFFRPYAESNCLCMPLALFREIGGYESRFDTHGGGNANLDIYRRACLHPKAELIVLPGEGTFHQFHGGVTTNISKDSLERQQIMHDLAIQYEAVRGTGYSAPEKHATYLGSIAPEAMRFVEKSAERTALRGSPP